MKKKQENFGFSQGPVPTQSIPALDSTAQDNMWADRCTSCSGCSSSLP